MSHYYIFAQDGCTLDNGKCRAYSSSKYVLVPHACHRSLFRRPGKSRLEPGGDDFHLKSDLPYQHLRTYMYESKLDQDITLRASFILFIPMLD